MFVVYVTSLQVLREKKAPPGRVLQYPPFNKQRYVIREQQKWTEKQKGEEEEETEGRHSNRQRASPELQALL